MQRGQAADVAEKLKNKANECFHKGKLGAAIDLYTEAFTLCPHWTIPLVNRALCHKKNSNWMAVIEDCVKVLSMDSQSLKGHYFLGLAYTHTNQFNKAVDHLEQALELGRERDSRIKEEVWRSLAKAKYESHSSKAAERAVQRSELYNKIKKLLKEDAGTNLNSSAIDVDVIIDKADEHNKELMLLDEIFQSDYQKYHGEDTPSWCACQLTLEVFHEPVVTPCGISYEQGALMEHLNKVGSFDPVTRRPMTAKDIRKNVGLRNAVESYLNDNPWAWEHAM